MVTHTLTVFRNYFGFQQSFLFVRAFRKGRSLPPTKCPAEYLASAFLRTAATLSQQETDMSSSGTWMLQKNGGYLSSSPHIYFPLTYRSLRLFFYSSLYSGQQYSASNRTVWVARRPQEPRFLWGRVWSWPHGSQHLLHY